MDIALIASHQRVLHARKNSLSHSCYVNARSNTSTPVKAKPRHDVKNTVVSMRGRESNDYIDSDWIHPHDREVILDDSPVRPWWPVTNHKTLIDSDIPAESLLWVDFKFVQQHSPGGGGWQSSELRCYSSLGKHYSSRGILTSPTSVEEFSVAELKPWSNYLTRQKSLKLEEETIKGPRDKASLKGTAWLKKVLSIIENYDDCHLPQMCLQRARRSRP